MYMMTSLFLAHPICWLCVFVLFCAAYGFIDFEDRRDAQVFFPGNFAL